MHTEDGAGSPNQSEPTESHWDLIDNPSDADLPETLYHYTDLRGVQGIWENGELWGTNALFLNDTSEVELGTLVIQNAVSERQRDLYKQLAESLSRELETRQAGDAVDADAFEHERGPAQAKLDELKFIQDAIDYVKDTSSFITCLTEQHDQLSQWRGYAREGYCIGFKTTALLENLHENLVTRRVRYYDAETNAEYAHRTVDIASRLRAALLTYPDLASDDDTIKFILGKKALIDASFIKDSNFAEESEVRIVHPTGTADLFTPHRYGMVPRIKIPIVRDAVKSVRVGPSAHAELKQKSLQMYLLEVPFGGKEPLPVGERTRPAVYVSKIPYRDW
ncbi:MULTISPECIES: DUF2971 domain-containing protein [unclassified Mycolicibacterium]|uniref:DUF2971 domain-containing protein n=1 Tax=unclassified Mycolicibacterium TaxID=2636767 RepID=UPI0012DCE319|nr:MULTISPECIES: DUF2971 domain-containing protein [unclassified Mycolicibacterium]MUL85217.1 DUF2971 domain-containing protein [Mycolicibacterium sp. CBMA 329]MUL91184.1 DUF2971 domain-containing protein [Mycolicibacterium sp. CBMA 331]MUL98147.1 DUF2971 domain-containing protein [Mycolicibacterium sp. CBMA 334]MUM25753.1 DUF2971 domain-containing protein [Mycolicibacterium sp. CBMA 295]MUM40943.1 DUF2971 domain-containing protein [Mycolicibacterium sp. CBMA 247]